MPSWGYGVARGEVVALNRGYGSASPWHALQNWLSSASHRAIVLGAFDRVGCGAWVAADGTVWYSCLFSRGGHPVATPRPRTPRPATPRPATPRPGTPRPATPQPSHGATPAAPAPSPTPSPTEEPEATPEQPADDSESSEPTDAVPDPAIDASPTADVAGVQATAEPASPTDPAANLVADDARSWPLAVAVGLAMAALVAMWAVLVRRRRRRRAR